MPLFAGDGEGFRGGGMWWMLPPQEDGGAVVHEGRVRFQCGSRGGAVIRGGRGRFQQHGNAVDDVINTMVIEW